MKTVITCPHCKMTLTPIVHYSNKFSNYGLYCRHPLQHTCHKIFDHILFSANDNKSIGNGLTLSINDIHIFQNNINKAYQICILQDF